MERHNYIEDACECCATCLHVMVEAGETGLQGDVGYYCHELMMDVKPGGHCDMHDILVL